MLDANNRSGRDFSHFDELSTEELRNMIHQDSMLDENEDSDLDAILYIMEVLARREKEDPNSKTKDVDTAWQSFKKDYYPYTADPEPLFSFTETEEPCSPAPDKPRMPILKRLIRPLSVAAIIVIVLLAGTVTSYALGYDLWGAFAAWTHETFHFSSSEAAATPQPFENLRDALDAYGITDPIIPNWVPERVESDVVQVSEVPNGVHFVSTSNSPSCEISVEIKAFSGTDVSHRTFELLDKGVEEYFSNGVVHYIMQNSGLTRITWLCGNNECSILCSMEKEEIYKMIDSMYER